jgi:hypothetical protein
VKRISLAIHAHMHGTISFYTEFLIYFIVVCKKILQKKIQIKSKKRKRCEGLTCVMKKEKKKKKRREEDVAIKCKI